VREANRFAHASEAELARILDYYQVAWQYEPRSFPILWNLDGAVVESFAPDFYLPEFDLYLELTTLRQSLVRRKNRKLRRLRELYPMLRVKLFYGKDFRQLLLKYGRIDLASSLSGIEGQVGVTPPVEAVAERVSAMDPGAATDQRPASAVSVAAVVAVAPAVGPVPAGA
jgi:hypoxanthine phosphoribosyltransferase